MTNTYDLPSPKDVFRFFYDISAIPRPSGSEEAIGDYLIRFAEERSLECHRDGAGNVLIISEASPGRENDPPLILQGHMDMVCEKEPGCEKDMSAEGLDLTIDGDWMSAEGTTLGGDDGIAVAISLAVLDDAELSHPRIEFICTTEEETGMGGAQGLDVTYVKGRQLLNIDSEDEGIMTVGCAGGETVGITIPAERCEKENEAFASMVPAVIRAGSLTGGHSGVEIGAGRANACAVLIRILRRLQLPVISVSGGGKNNAIPREAQAVVLTSDMPSLSEKISSLEKELKLEYAVTDPDLSVSAEKAEPDAYPDAPLTERCANDMIALLGAVPDGVQRMDQHLKDLVQTSLNFGILLTSEEGIYAEYLLRSSLGSALDDLAERIEAIAAPFGADVRRSDRYPAWEYAENYSLCLHHQGSV